MNLPMKIKTWPADGNNADCRINATFIFERMNRLSWSVSSHSMTLVESDAGYHRGQCIWPERGAPFDAVRATSSGKKRAPPAGGALTVTLSEPRTACPAL